MADEWALRRLTERSAIAHGFGGGPENDYRVRDSGTNINRLIDDAIGYDPYTSEPPMTAFVVTVRRKRCSAQI